MSFKISQRFRDAADISNQIPVEKFPLLLNRIIEKLHLRNERLFNENEETKLKNLFTLSSEELRLVLDCCCYIFEQSAFSGTGPEPLYDILLEAGFDEPHGKVVGKLWANEAASYMGKLKSRTLGSKTLIETNYHLNVIMSDSLQSQRHDPTSLFEFTLSNDSDNNNAVDVVSNEGGNKKDKAGEKICVEFDHSELFSLFTNLEKIQSQLDGLSGSK